MISEGRASCLAFWELCKPRLSHTLLDSTSFLFGSLMHEDYHVITDVKAFSEWQAGCTYLNKKTWQASHFTVISLGHFSKAEDSRQSDFKRPASVIIPWAQPEEFDCCSAWELMNNDTENSREQQTATLTRLLAATEREVCLHMEFLSPLLNLKLLLPCPQTITSSIKLQCVKGTKNWTRDLVPALQFPVFVTVVAFCWRIWGGVGGNINRSRSSVSML